MLAHDFQKRFQNRLAKLMEAFDSEWFGAFLDIEIDVSLQKVYIDIFSVKICLWILCSIKKLVCCNSCSIIAFESIAKINFRRFVKSHPPSPFLWEFFTFVLAVHVFFCKITPIILKDRWVNGNKFRKQTNFDLIF